MIRIVFAVLGLAIGFANLAAAQSTDDIIKSLTRPAPVFRGNPFNEKGITIVDPVVAKPPSIDLLIPFEYNSDRLAGDAILVLRRLGKALKNPKLIKDRIEVAGYTDAKGSLAYNQNLSERRAQAVKDYLVYQYDIDAARLRVKGFGKTHLKDPAHPYSAINRRVQIVNLGAD